MRLPLTLALMLGVAACGTPRQQCDATATRDLSVVNDLIAEAEANISRGYAIESGSTTRPMLTFCATANSAATFCTTNQTVATARPVAIDLAAERAKLVGLQQKRTELNAAAAASLAQCQALYPAG